MSPSIEQILIDAEALIHDEKNWIAGAWYANERGFSVPVEDACRFCMEGAVDRAIFDSHQNSIRTMIVEEINSYVKKLTGVYMMNLNDVHGHETVIATLNMLINLAQANELDDLVK